MARQATRCALLLVLVAESRARIVVPLPGQISPGAINPKGGVNEQSICMGDVCLPPAIHPGLAAFCRALTSLQQESGQAFDAAGGLLHRYCSNVASNDDPKYRRIKKTNKAFARDLAPFRSAAACLGAVGFEETTTDGGVEQLVLTGKVNKALLKDAATAVEAALAPLMLRDEWPKELLGELNSTCATLVHKPLLLDELASELRQSHISKLLSHKDNLIRVKTQLTMGTDGIQDLCAQLQEVRANVSTSALERGPAVDTVAAGATAGRVTEVGSMEQWYDMQMNAKGLLVVAFGAEWCGACKHAAPYFESLSTRERYRDVTFAHVDIEALPVLVGDERVSAVG